MLFDPIYWIIIAIGGVLSLAATFMVKRAFAIGKEVETSNGMTGADVARAILNARGIDGVQVVEHQGFLSDHYNPAERVLALSPDVYHGRHASAAGVAAHEVGHALQHAFGYVPLHLRSALVGPANIGSMLGPWLIIGGILLGAAQGIASGQMIAIAGVALFGAGTLFTLITLPVEFDASRRAKEILLEDGLIGPGEERAAVAKVLNAAGMTYVAAAITSTLMLLYWAVQAGLLGGSRE